MTQLSRAWRRKLIYCSQISVLVRGRGARLPEPAPVIEDEPEPIDYSALGSEELARRLHEEDVKLGIAK